MAALSLMHCIFASVYSFTTREFIHLHTIFLVHMGHEDLQEPLSVSLHLGPSVV